MPITNIFAEYANVKAQIKALEQKEEQLRPFIIEQMVDENVEKIETDAGSFSVTMLKKWTYPEAVMELGEEFKAAKAKAVSTKEATYEEEPSLRFTAAKL
jgi:hypothetical protein